MRTIVAGSRSIVEQETVNYVLNKLVLEGFLGITEVVSGKAKGVDTLAENWAHTEGIPVQEFPADWDNVDIPGAKKKSRRDGSVYNVLAGYMRNQDMADYADALVAIWDGKSKGTKDMIERARKKGLAIYVYNKSTKRLQRENCPPRSSHICTT